jgi:hypothetical protein
MMAPMTIAVMIPVMVTANSRGLGRTDPARPCAALGSTG